MLPGEILAAANIKGSHTLDSTADQANVSLEDLLDSLELPPETDTTVAVRELVRSGDIPEVTVVRAAVAKLQSE